MKKNLVQLLPAFIFLLLIFGIGICGIFSQDNSSSTAERRRLAQFTPPTISSLMSGQWAKDFDKYTADQFPARDQFRSLNALARTKLLLQQEVGGLYLVDDVVFKSDYPLTPANIDRFVEKTNAVYRAYVQGKAAAYYVAVVPDKGHFDTSPRLKTDAQSVQQQFTVGLQGATPIDIFSALNLASYYKTDTHWAQQKLFPVMDSLSAAMDFPAPSASSYTTHEYAPFYGVYWGQSALNPPPDSLRYLTSPWIDSATASYAGAAAPIYNTAALTGMDAYELFLQGSTPIVTIESPNSTTEKELVLFRDSFGSSLVPLLLEPYRKVTVVDLRYFSPSLLPQYVDFTGKDVLVLYSSLILNSNIQLK